MVSVVWRLVSFGVRELSSVNTYKYGDIGLYVNVSLLTGSPVKQRGQVGNDERLAINDARSLTVEDGRWYGRTFAESYASSIPWTSFTWLACSCTTLQFMSMWTFKVGGLGYWLCSARDCLECSDLFSVSWLSIFSARHEEFSRHGRF